MREKLADLEKISRRLDPDQPGRKQLFAQVQDYAQQFLEELPSKDTYTKDVGSTALTDSPFEEAPSNMIDLLDFYEREVDTSGILTISGGHLGYIPGGGLYPAALGDYLAAVSNRYSGVSFAGPGPARMEQALVDWMCELVGYPDTAAGDLTSGGSIATLSALVTARDACGIDNGQIRDACIYLTSQAHHCVGKALHVAGLGKIHKRIVPMDSRFRMEVSTLEHMIRDDLAAGLTPWVVVASGGTTDTGAVDPISDIADLCEQFDLWFHLDAAYGGFFLLCDEGRDRLAGIDRADSIIMDPHKGLGITYGSGAVLVKEGRKLAASNAYYADYMQDAISTVPDLDRAFSPADYSLELTRHFRGPRMWLPLKLFGLAPFRASLAEKIWLARYFHQELEKLDGFTAGPRPDLSIVTFRYCPARAEANDINKRLMEAVHNDGKVFITSTQIDGRFTLRLAVLNFRTHLETIDYLLALLKREAKALDLPPG